MHPKSLEDLCIDEIVLATVNYRITCTDPQMLCRNVRALWSEIYITTVVSRAHFLLHQCLSCPNRVPENKTEEQKKWIYNFAVTFLTFLAAKSPKVEFVYTDCFNNPFPFVDVNQWSVFSEEEHFLQKLVLTSVDFGNDLTFLENLLPRCRNLSILKLGNNTTDGVLYSARCCPLTTLHICEGTRFRRKPLKTRVSLRVLYEVLLGIEEGREKQVMADIRQGKQIHLSSSWPQLLDLSTGNYAVTTDFLILVLVAFPQFKDLYSSEVSISRVIKEYGRLSECVPHLHPLSMRCRQSSYGDLGTMYKYLPNMEMAWLTVSTDIEANIRRALEIITSHLPCVSGLCLPISRDADPSVLPPRESFEKATNQISRLELNCINCDFLSVDRVFQFLDLFPSVTQLKISGCKLLMSDIDPQIEYTSVTALKCVCEKDDMFMDFLRAFPNLHSLVLSCDNRELEFPWKRLTGMRQLRDLKLTALRINDVDGLCSVPRATPGDRRQWRLCTWVCSLEEWEIAKLRRCGWTCFLADDFYSELLELYIFDPPVL